MLYKVLSVVYMIVSVLIVAFVLMQKSKDQGLSALSGQSIRDTYWGKNKSRSAEGRLKMVTRILVLLYIGLSVGLMYVGNHM